MASNQIAGLQPPPTYTTDGPNLAMASNLIAGLQPPPTYQQWPNQIAGLQPTSNGFSLQKGPSLAQVAGEGLSVRD